MNKGPAITAAFIASPVGSLVASFAMVALRFTDDYERQLASNSRSRANGFPIPDPSQYEFLVSIVPTTLTIAAAGTIFAIIANLIIGVPTILISADLFRESRMMQLIAPTIIGAGIGLIIWKLLLGRGLQFYFLENLPGLIAGGVAAFSMALCARLFSEEPKQDA